MRNYIGIIVRTIKKILMRRTLSFYAIKALYKETYDAKIKAEVIPQPELSRFYTDFYLYGMHSVTNASLINKDYINVGNWNKACAVKSLYEYQRKR